MSVLTRQSTSPDVILAVDPGGTTGLAEFSTDYNKIWIGYQFPRFGVEDHIHNIFEWHFKDIVAGRILIVAEKFLITPHTGRLSQQDDALKINGTLEWMAHKFGHRYEEQTPNTAKKIAKDFRLKELGLFTPGRDHANDAARHLVLALERHIPSVFESDGLFGYNSSLQIEQMRDKQVG